MTSLFGTSGIRGKAKTLFTPQFCFDIARAFDLFLAAHKQSGVVSLGIDPRSSSPAIAKHFSAGLAHQKRKIIYLGMVPVPAVHYSILSTPSIASVMVTGSHIDAHSNGLKFFALKEEIEKNHEAEIERLYQKVKNKVKYLPKSSSPLPSADRSGFNHYYQLLLSLADQPLPKLKIVADPGNGSQTEIIHYLLKELKQETIFLNNHLDQPLISRDTETDGSFNSLQQAVIKHQASLGIGFDSDGDRVIFVDHQGRFISGDYSGTLLAKYNPSNIIVTPINTSSVIDSINKEIIRTKVGSPYVVSAIKKYHSGFGFESNGGGIHSDVMLSRDGGTSMVRILNLLKKTNRSLASLIDQLPQYSIKRDKFDCPREKNKTILKQAKKFIPSQSIDTTDGVKLILDNHTWVLFRPSSNAPEFRVFVQSNSITKAKQIITDALKFAKKIAHA